MNRESAPAAIPAASGGVVETPHFFPRGDARLFGMLHLPRGQVLPTAFVMSHAFGEEKLWSHRVFVGMARALAQRGHVVMRFDYTGAGDSSGMTQDASMDVYLSDLAAALAAMQERAPKVERVGFVGMRLGASTAALFAEAAAQDGRSTAVARGPLILWDPILDGESYFQELLRSNLATQMAIYGSVRDNRDVLQARIRDGGTVNVDGYEIGPSLFMSSAKPDLLTSAAKKHAGPTLVVQIAASEQAKVRDDLSTFAQSYPKGTFARVVEQPFWREIKRFIGRSEGLEKATLDWLEQSDV